MVADLLAVSMNALGLNPIQALGLPTSTYIWLAGNEGMEKKMEATIMGFIS